MFLLISVIPLLSNERLSYMGDTDTIRGYIKAFMILITTFATLLVTYKFYQINKFMNIPIPEQIKEKGGKKAADLSWGSPQILAENKSQKQ